MTTKPKAKADDAADAGEQYDPVAHMLQAQIEDHKAQIEALEKQLADRA